MMRFPITALLTVLSIAPAALLADVTIRYKADITSAMPLPPGMSDTTIYMKGNKGVTIAGGQIAIADFAKQEVTVIDSASRKYATIPVQEYAAKIASAMPGFGDSAEMLKSMKTTCASSKPAGAGTIQGIQAEERDVTCSTTMSMPQSSQPTGNPGMGMSMKFVVRTWTASQTERLRVPGLWQLSGFELWNSVFMNPTAGFDKAAPGLAPMMEEMRKTNSVTLRSTMEMYMDMQMPAGFVSPAPSNKPLMTMKNEVVEISTAPLDDSLFSIPADCTAAPFGDLMNGMVQARLEAMKKPAAKAPGAPQPDAIPASVKAYVPSLMPLTRTEAEIPDEARAKDIQGRVEVLVTVGMNGKVEQAEALGGPQELRKAATDAVALWTFRPVIRDGAPVMAYTDTTVFFFDKSKGPVTATGMMPDMAAEGRKDQLAEAMPRTPRQILADLEQDAGGGDKSRRFALLDHVALAAVKADAWEKAAAYAKELLAVADEEANRDRKGQRDGDAIHDGHMVLGLVAMRNDDVATARQQLLEAGKTPGSPVLNSFGPNMSLASELLKRGERDVVLDYFAECRTFWKMGVTELDSWRDAVSRYETPFWGASLR